MAKDVRVDLCPGQVLRVYVTSPTTLRGGVNKSKRTATLSATGVYVPGSDPMRECQPSAPPSLPPDPEVPDAPGGPAGPIGGYGAEATGGTTPFSVTTTSPTGAGSIMDALSADGRLITFAVSGTIDLGEVVRTVGGRSAFTLDGGGDITLVGGPLWFEDCSDFIVRNIRHRGGWDAGQSADNFTNVGCTDFAYANVSASGSYDEGISSTRDCRRYTLQDCLFGEGGDSDHDFGSLNYGHTANRNGPGSFIRNVFIGKDYRNPKLGYRGDAENGSPNPSAPDPAGITYDVVNNIAVNCNYGLSATNGAKVNNTNPYNSGNSHGNEVITGAVIRTGLPVEAYAVVAALSPAEAKEYAKTHAGCLPHDSFDTSLLAALS